MGLHLAEVSSPVFKLLRERKRAEERIYAVFLRVFSVSANYYLSLHRSVYASYVHVVKFEDTIAGLYDHWTFKQFDA